jgi:chemotaxis protein MotA
MDILRTLVNSLTRAAGIALLVFSVYYGINHEAARVHMGVLHIPSLGFVGLGLLGIVFASYQTELIAMVTWNTLFNSPTRIRRKFLKVEKLLPSLTDTYYQQGPAIFLEESKKKRLPKLWKFIALKLEAQVPLPDIQALVQNQGKIYNERLFTQIRVLQGLATVAPAVGMTGTILGLIKLLKDLHDFQNLGSNMALAFITALYGLLFGNFLFIPLTNRLNAAREEMMHLLSQALFWIDMISSRKPAHYLDAKEQKKITA